jgi:CheY-like chemotaxis protein
MRVLIIDDDEDLRGLLARYITQRWSDAEIEEFDPLERDLPGPDFPLRSYDVIILDYMLGRGDGLDWLQRLKSRPDCPKILFLTGAGNEIIAVRAMKAGADDYQRKQEMTREKLITSLRELTADAAEKTVSPELASRLEGHNLGAKIRIPGIKVLRLIAVHGGVLTGRAHPEPPRGAHLRPRQSGEPCLPGDGILRRRRSQQTARGQAAAGARGTSAVPRAHARARRHP